MKRLIIVYNPRSSKYLAVKKDVLEKVRGLDGFLIGKFEVQRTSLEENAKNLAGLVREGDLVVAAGGDGTVAVAVNGIMLARKKAVLGVLGYGDFNDFSKTTKTKSLEEILRKFEQGEAKKFWPLEVVVDGRHFRYAVGYVTVGMLAKAAGIFDGGKIRAGLKRTRGNRVYSILQLVKWYFGNRRKVRMGEMKVNGKGVVKNTTDYVAMNAERMGGFVRGGEFYKSKREFSSGTKRLGNLFGMVWFMFGKFNGKRTSGDKLSFSEPSEAMIQTEGESFKLEKVKEISIKKAEKEIYIIYG